MISTAIDECWGVEALRERLRGEQIRNADLQRRFDRLQAHHHKLQRQVQRLYNLLSPEVKAALDAAAEQQAEEDRELNARLLRSVGIRA